MKKISGGRWIVLMAALSLIAVACAQTDAGLTTKVKAKLAADDTVKAYQIDVDTRDKVVTLSGSVDSQAAKDQAASLARSTEGVADVVDNVTVSGGGAATTGTDMGTMGTTGTGMETTPGTAMGGKSMETTPGMSTTPGSMTTPSYSTTPGRP